MTPFYRRPISLKAVAVALAVPLFGLGAPFLLWQAWNARPLNVAREFAIDTPDTPVPNAHDLFQQAEATFSKNLDRRDLPSATLDWRDDPPPKTYPLAGKVRWIGENQNAFALFDRGLKAKYLFPPVRTAHRGGTLESPYLLRWLARYVTVEVEALAQQKRFDAARRALDIWQMGVQASHGAPSNAALNAMLVESGARQALDGEIAHLDGPQATKAAHRLEELLQARSSYSATLTQERDAQLFQWKAQIEKNIYDERRAREIEAQMQGQDTVYISTDAPIPEINGPVINWQVRRINSEWARGMNALIAGADAPWSKRETNLPAIEDEKLKRLLGHVGKSRFFHAKADALGQLTLTRLALHAYRKDRGTYPATLNELAPRYLSRVPGDVFADGAPLRYERSGQRYRLWSVGPDAKNDGGRAMIFAAARTAQGKHMVTSEATGDIVANVNR